MTRPAVMIAKTTVFAVLRYSLLLAGTLGPGLWTTTPARGQDLIELLSGAKVEGRVTNIDVPGKQVSFDALIGGRSFPRVYTYDRIHAVTYQGKRYVINEMGAAPERASPRPSTGSTASSGAVARGGNDAKSQIASVGKTAPDWYDSTPLDYPASLDLNWPEPAPEGWNNQRNMGQYIWDVINPNPSRWRGGLRLLHHLLGLHKDDAAKQQRIMVEMGRMYFELLQDYPRAAFWYQQAGVGRGGRWDNSRNAAHLAECYWRLGDRSGAVELMNKLPLTYDLIKLWGDIGETQKCVQLATASAQNAQAPGMNYLIVGDVYRLTGDYSKSLAAYRTALEKANAPNHPRADQVRNRAQANIAALQALASIDLKRTPDGAYRASSLGYEGPVEVEVRVAGQRIESVRVTQHREKQFYSSIDDTTAKLVAQQGIKGVDATSGATITSEAIINAAAKALASAAQ